MIKLYPHQVEAIQKWHSNGGKGIISMATGTGKTFTAMGIIDKVIKRDRSLVVVSVPYSHLIPQWQRSIQRYGIVAPIILAYGDISGWKKQVKVAIRRL